MDGLKPRLIGRDHHRGAGGRIAGQAFLGPFGFDDAKVLQVHAAAFADHVLDLEDALIDGAVDDAWPSLGKLPKALSTSANTLALSVA